NHLPEAVRLRIFDESLVQPRDGFDAILSDCLRDILVILCRASMISIGARPLVRVGLVSTGYENDVLLSLLCYLRNCDSKGDILAVWILSLCYDIRLSVFVPFLFMF